MTEREWPQATSGIVEAALEISKRRNAILLQMRDALERGDDAEA